MSEQSFYLRSGSLPEKIPVVVLGATGSVGQRFIQLLDGHPWFEVVALTGSERTFGQEYIQACKWILPESMPAWAKQMIVEPSDPERIRNARIAFSALPAEQASQVEPLLAQAGLAVCSNASTFRRENDVPILLPEVNPDHVNLVYKQRTLRDWRGCIVTNPNCTSTGLTVALKALQSTFGLRKVFAVSLQALSGAGYPGVPSLDILDNVIPLISGEEEKVEWEPRKILGKIQDEQIIPADVLFSAHTNRVAVSDGHMVCVSVELDHPVDLDEVIHNFRNYLSPVISRKLPSSPQPPILVRDEPDRPQPKLDRMAGKGMATVIGRIRPDPLLHIKFVVLSHNTIRGAAGGSIFNAELLVQEGLIQ